MLLIRVLSAYLLLGYSNSHVHHHHDLDHHDHDHHHHHHHHHGHVHLRSAFDADEIGHERNLNTNTFNIFGKSFPSKEEFIGSGANCRFQSPPPERKRKVKKRLWKIRRRKEKLKYWKDKFQKPRQLQEALTEINVQVHFHIIQKEDANGNLISATITDNQVNSQIDALNIAYGGGVTTDCNNSPTPQGAVTPFKFELATLERKINSDWYDAPSTYQSEMFTDLRRGNCSDLNIYTTGGDGYLGWASFPDECENDLLGDGVIVYEETLPGGTAAPFNLGDTAVHEVGHWLGLLHTFEGGCDGGDSVDDTPAEETSASGCPVSRDTCAGDGQVDPIHNFMDYSDDCCMYEFTGGQTERMTFMADTYRNLRSVDSSEEYSSYLDPDLVSSVECEASEAKLTVIITTDGFGSETSWELFDSDSNGPIYNEPEEGQVFADNNTYETSKCLSPGSYTFRINDAFGDGLCCENGNGSFSVFLDGELIASGAEDFSYLDYDFNVGIKCKDFALAVTTDQFGEETSWTVKDSSGTIIQEAEQGQYDDSTKYVTRACLPLSDYYSFQIKDSEQDGICCSYGKGRYNVRYDNVPIHEGGNFGIGTSHVLGECPPNQAKFSLYIHMDRYPTETRWKLLTSDWTLLDKGDGYSKKESEFYYDTCLPTNQCYRFRIFDRAGDGICCSNGAGSYSMSFDGFTRQGGNFNSRQTTLFGNNCRVIEESPEYRMEIEKEKTKLSGGKINKNRTKWKR